MFDSGWESEPGGGPSRAWSGEQPGPSLVAALAATEAVDIANDDGFDAAERIGGWEAVVAWATARQLRETADYLHARQARVKQAPGPLERAREEVAMEVAAYGRVALRTGDHRLHHALALTERLPLTLEQLEAGRISLSHARVVIDQTEECDDETARHVDSDLWNRPARERTPTQMRETVRRIVLRLAPEALLRRATRARDERTVRYWSDDDGATGVITARLPAEEARGVFAVIDAVARRAGDPDGEERSLGNKRADAFRDLVLDAASGMTYGCGGAHDADGHEHDQEPSDAPDPEEPDEAQPDEAEPRESEPADPGGPSPVGDDPGGDDPAAARDPATGTCGDGSVRPVRTEVRITVPWEVLAGLSERPAELEGHGPIPADAARAMAFGRDAIWWRLLTDPVSGVAEHLDVRRYRPPERLRDFVCSRDLTCAAPGCRAPAARCDLDHTIAYDHTAPSRDGGRGRTAAHNLKPFCRRHHNIKTHGGWRCEPVPDPNGARTPAVRWTSRTGRSWLVRAPALDRPPWETNTHDVDEAPAAPAGV